MKLLFPDDPEARRRRDRVLVVLFVLASVFLVLKASRKTGGVLLRNQEFGTRFLERADPYWNPRFEAPFHGPYPPSFALVAAPLALLPTPVARVAWATLQVGALVACFHLGRRRLRRHWPELAPHAAVISGAALLLASRYVLRDMAGGGGNLLYGTLAFLGLELALAGRERMAGLPLGLGLVLKPNLAPLLLALVLLRRRRAALAAVGVAFVLFWTPALYYGPAEYAAEAARWARRVTAYAALDDLHRSELVPEAMPPAENAMNQSLRESVHRLLRSPGDSGAPDVHVVETSPAVASWIARALGLALLGVAAVSCRRARGPRAEWLAALGFLPLCMLLSPITWKAHHAALLPFFFALAAFAADRARRPGWLVPLLAGYWVLCDLLSEELLGREGKNVLQAVSLVAWADVVLIVVTLVLVLRERASTSDE